MKAIGTVKIDDNGLPWLMFWGVGLLVQGVRMPPKEVIAEMNAADKKAPPIKREGSYYTWRKKGFEGFDPDVLDEGKE